MNRQARSCGKDGQKAPLEIASRFPLSHSSGDDEPLFILDDHDHFSENPKASVASLRRLITPIRNADHDQLGTLITFIGIRKFATHTSEVALRYPVLGSGLIQFGRRL
jgi:hypothetical protein